MKKYFLLLTMLPLLCNAQSFLGAGTSYSTQKSVQLSLHIGYQANHFEGEGLMSIPMDRIVDHASYFGAKAGYSFHVSAACNIVPMAGMFYSMKSTDKKSLNTWQPGANIRVSINPFFFECTYIQKQFQAGFGIRGFL